MKNVFQISIILTLVLTITLSGCGGPDTGEKRGMASPKNPQPGYSVSYRLNGMGDMVEGISFNMNYVPGKKFRTGLDDFGTDSVDYGFMIGETEVTYRLWYRVYTWAVQTGQYRFNNPGVEGSNSPGPGYPPSNVNFPVTCINWRDAIVWCNALTEYFNRLNQLAILAVYRYDNQVIKDATDPLLFENITITENSRGFRLPFSKEWELAARFIGDDNNDGTIVDPGEYYLGNRVSGDQQAYVDSYLQYVVGIDNSYSTAWEVKKRVPNALGLYDMSGNIQEWCFDRDSITFYRVLRGGSWASGLSCLAVGYELHTYELASNNTIGFRLARSL